MELAQLWEARMDKYRKLMIHGINAALDSGRLTLETPPNDGPTNEDGHIETMIAGQPSIVAWSSIGYGEVRVSVWWKYNHSAHPQANLQGNMREQFHTSSPLAKRSKYPAFVGATVSGWLERKTSKHLQGKGSERLFDIYLRKGEKEALEGLPEPKPKGYLAEGKFYF